MSERSAGLLSLSLSFEKAMTTSTKLSPRPKKSIAYTDSLTSPGTRYGFAFSPDARGFGPSSSSLSPKVLRPSAAIPGIEIVSHFGKNSGGERGGRRFSRYGMPTHRGGYVHRGYRGLSVSHIGARLAIGWVSSRLLCRHWPYVSWR